MKSSTQEYDASGVSSSLLGTGLLLLFLGVLFPFAYPKRTLQPFSCECKLCDKTRKKSKTYFPNGHKLVFWGALVLLVFPLRTFLYGEYARSFGFDPYEILGVSASTKPKEIERAYRKVVRVTKFESKDKKEEREKVQVVIRAYETLTDPKKREAWDSFGEGASTQQAYTVALPAWMLASRASSLIIFAYLLLFGLLLPKLVAFAWQSSSGFSAVGLSYATTESIYQVLRHSGHFSGLEALLRAVAPCSAEAGDLAKKIPTDIRAKIAAACRENMGIDVEAPSGENEGAENDAFLLLMAVVSIRGPGINDLIPTDIQGASQILLQRLTKAVRVLSFHLQRRDTYHLSFALEKCAIQGIPDSRLWSLQYPGTSLEQALALALDVPGSKMALDADGERIDAEMFRAKIAAVDLYTPEDGVLSKGTTVSSASDLSVRIVITKEGAKYLHVEPTVRKSGHENSTGNLDEALGAEESPEISPRELEKHPIHIRGAIEEGLPVHAPMYKNGNIDNGLSLSGIRNGESAATYAWTAVLEVNGTVVMESPGFTPSEVTEVLFRMPPLKTLIANGKTKTAVLDVLLINTSFFNRDVRARRTLSVR